MSVSLKQSYDIEYNGTANVSRMDLFVDTAADLSGLTTFDSITLLQGSTAKDISTGDEYMMQTGGTWVKQPSQSASANVYTKAEIDSMLYLYYTKAEADALFEWTTFTTFTTFTTDTMSITFIADGSPLISWSMLGNGRQTGTPTPDAPIMPEFVGVRTGNLAPPLTEWVDGFISTNGTIVAPSDVYKEKSSNYISVKAGAVYTFSIENGFSEPSWRAIGWYTQDKTFISRASGNASYALSTNAPSNAVYCRLSYRTGGETTNPMLNTGSTALPYEPYGWAEKITCAGQTVPVYLGQAQTVRRIKKVVFTGQETWTEVYPGEPEAQAQGIVMYATTMSDIGTDRNDFICSHFFVGNYSGYLISGQGRINGRSPEGFTVNYNNGSGGLQNFKSWLASEYAAGHPVTLWYALATEQTAIVNEPLCKIGTYADELSSTDAAVTIPITRGENTLTIGTTLQPSEITITGKIREVTGNEQ